MRTTIDMPDQLFRRVKATAALRGTSLKRFITEAVEGRLLGEAQPRRTRKRIHHPLVPSKKPGAASLTGRMIARILAADDSDATTGH